MPSSKCLRKVIVINGWSAGECLWDNALKDLKVLANDVEVVDLGSGKTMEELERMLIQASVPETLLIGWSLGAQVAINCLLNSRELSNRVTSLVALQATPCFVEKDNWSCGYDLGEFNALYQSCVDKDLDAVKRVFAHLMVKGSESIRSDRKLIKQLYVKRNLPDQAVLLNGLEQLRENDLRGNLENISVPVFWLLGEMDCLVSRNLADELTRLGQNQVDVVSGMGHFPCGSYWYHVFDSIQRFIEVK